jgi:hypothetical protein
MPLLGLSGSDAAALSRRTGAPESLFLGAGPSGLGRHPRWHMVVPKGPAAAERLLGFCLSHHIFWMMSFII